MRKLVRKIRIRFWISAALLTVMSASFLLMPIAEAYEGFSQRCLEIVSGLLFWVPAIGGYVTFFVFAGKTLKVAKELHPPSFSKVGKVPGVFKAFSNYPLIITDAVLSVGIIAEAILIYLGRNQGIVAFFLIAIIVWSLNMHCLFSSNVYIATKLKRRGEKRNENEV